MYKYTAKLSIQYPENIDYSQKVFFVNNQYCNLDNEIRVENILLGSQSIIISILEALPDKPEILLIKELRLESEFTELQILKDFQEEAKAILNRSFHRICFFTNANINLSEIKTFASLLDFPEFHKNQNNPCDFPVYMNIPVPSCEMRILPGFCIKEYKSLLKKEYDSIDRYIREYLDIKKIKNPETRLFALARLKDLIDSKNPNKKTVDVDKLNQAARHLVTHGHLINSCKSKNNKECFDVVKQYFLCSCQVDIKPQIVEEKYKDKIIFDRDDPQHMKLIKSAVHEFDQKIEEYLRKIAISD